MKLTLVQPVLEGMVDDDYPPEVFAGHWTKEQASSYAKFYGSGYPHFRLEGVDGCWEAGFSNHEEDFEIFRAANSKLSAEEAEEAYWEGNLSLTIKWTEPQEFPKEAETT